MKHGPCVGQCPRIPRRRDRHTRGVARSTALGAFGQGGVPTLMHICFLMVFPGLPTETVVGEAFTEQKGDEMSWQG